ncbi:MAG: hydroxypyruvate isomerase family protein [Granulosicoccus sp.]
MIRFSANLGFLWTELSLPDAIAAAGRAGFDAVECHWPYDTDTAEVNAALEIAGLTMLGINTLRGNVDQGDNGVAAIVGRESEARQYIDDAIGYAAAIGCANVHVMAGFTDAGETAEATFQDNLRYACDKAKKLGVTILIEPLNHYDAPGYHLSTLDAALNTIQAVDQANIKIMFDCYHLQIMQGDLTRRLEQHLPAIGHIQIAAVPDRSEPDQGELHYPNLLAKLDQLNWNGFIGAEYKPRNGTDSGLGWLAAYR